MWVILHSKNLKTAANHALWISVKSNEKVFHDSTMFIFYFKILHWKILKLCFEWHLIIPKCPLRAINEMRIGKKLSGSVLTGGRAGNGAESTKTHTKTAIKVNGVLLQASRDEGGCVDSCEVFTSKNIFFRLDKGIL